MRGSVRGSLMGGPCMDKEALSEDAADHPGVLSLDGARSAEELAEQAWSTLRSQPASSGVWPPCLSPTGLGFVFGWSHIINNDGSRHKR